MNNFRTLNTVNTQINNSVNVTGQVLTVNNNAIEVMTSFAKIAPRLVNPNTSVDDATTILNAIPNLHHLFIGDENGIVGILNKKVLIGRHVLMTASKRGIQRSDLNVADLMEPIDTLPKLSLTTVEQSKIGDIKKTIEHLHNAMLAVIDENAGLVGIIFASDIEDALQESLNLLPMVHSFKDCFEIIHEGTELI